MLNLMNICRVIALTFTLSASAHDKKLRERYGLEGLPPTTLSLFEQEKHAEQQESLHEIEGTIRQVIGEAVKKGAKKKGKASTNQALKKSVSTGAKKSNGLIKKQKSTRSKISKEMNVLLAQQYDHPDLKNKRITLSFKQVAVRDAIDLLSRLSHVPFIVDSEIHSTVGPFSFDEISLSDILRIILSNSCPRLALLHGDNVLRVVTRSNAIEELALAEDKMVEKNTHRLTYTTYYARWNDEFIKKVKSLWKSIVGRSKCYTYLFFDKENKKIIVKGPRPMVDDFEYCMQEVDIKIPQIKIDMRIVLAAKNFEEAFGLNWSGIYDRSASLKSFAFAGVGIGASERDPESFQDLLNWSLNFIPGNITAPINLKIPFVFGNKDFSKRLNILLNLAENRHEIETLLKPTLLVRSEEAAEILVGEEMPQEVRLQESVEGNPTNITSINYKDIGIQVRVKPVVSPDHETIFLDVFVQNSVVTEVPFARRGICCTTAQDQGFNYTIETSRTTNRVLLKSAQTTLIGGLMVKQESKTRTGIPILQDLPGVGWLFGGRRKLVTDKQLLIFITPTLV